MPVLVHVEEVTQPQGHSTSGSHERYKSEERPAWAKEFDCIQKMSEFLIREGAATDDELQALRRRPKTFGHSKGGVVCLPCRDRRGTPLRQRRAPAGGRRPGWRSATTPTRAAPKSRKRSSKRLSTPQETGRRRAPLAGWLSAFEKDNVQRSTTPTSTAKATTTPWTWSPVPATYDADPEMLDGRQVLQRNFEVMFERDARVLTFGEDTGGIEVNQVMEGMQEKFGATRVSDTGIECTILGQGIGMAMRG